MSLRKTSFIKGEYFHIYNRGNSKQKIFHDYSDYMRFTKILYLSNSSRSFNMKDVSKDVFSFDKDNSIVSIGVYCLMPNHFHLLVTPIEEGSISKFMQKLTTAYSMYYNKKYERTGSLFEGKFKSQHINNDRYLKYLFSYIHLNPIKLIDKNWKKDGIKNKQISFKFLEKYKYSSFQDYLGLIRSGNIILNKKAFPEYFPTDEKFQKEIFEWLSYKEENP